MPRSDADAWSHDAHARCHAGTVRRVTCPVRRGVARHLAGRVPARVARCELSAASATEA